MKKSSPKKSGFTRRKFISKMGLTAGSAALFPALKNLQLGTKSGSKKGPGILSAWMPSSPRLPYAHLRILTRPAGSYLLPLTSRPF